MHKNINSNTSAVHIATYNEICSRAHSTAHSFCSLTQSKLFLALMIFPDFQVHNSIVHPSTLLLCILIEEPSVHFVIILYNKNDKIKSQNNLWLDSRFSISIFFRAIQFKYLLSIMIGFSQQNLTTQRIRKYGKIFLWFTNYINDGCYNVQEIINQFSKV